MNKKIPLRKCVVTREKLEKKELIRIVRDKNEHVEVDLTGKKNGRGAYIKKDLLVLEKAKKSNVLGKTLSTKISDEIYMEIENIIKENK